MLTCIKCASGSCITNIKIVLILRFTLLPVSRQINVLGILVKCPCPLVTRCQKDLVKARARMSITSWTCQWTTWTTLSTNHLLEPRQVSTGPIHDTSTVCQMSSWRRTKLALCHKCSRSKETDATVFNIKHLIE